MAGIEAIPFGLLVFVIGVLLVTNAWAVIDAKMTVASAAREATRAYVESPAGADPKRQAHDAATEAVRGGGRDPSRLVLTAVADGFRRCQRVTFSVSYPVPAVTLPWLGGFGHGFTATARHSEIVDPLRTGSHSARTAVTRSPVDRRRGWGRSQRGSVLLLFPVAVLIVIVLAAIAVDSAIAFLGQREVANAAVAAANDAAGQGVGNRAFYETGTVDLDPGTVERLATELVVAVLDPERFRDLAVGVAMSSPAAAGCPPTVRVHVSARVPTLFAAAIPGGPADRQVQATAVAYPTQIPQPGC